MTLPKYNCDRLKKACALLTTGMWPMPRPSVPILVLLLVGVAIGMFVGSLSEWLAMGDLASLTVLMCATGTAWALVVQMNAIDSIDALLGNARTRWSGLRRTVRRRALTSSKRPWLRHIRWFLSKDSRCAVDDLVNELVKDRRKMRKRGAHQLLIFTSSNFRQCAFGARLIVESLRESILKWLPFLDALAPIAGGLDSDVDDER